jgi:hypothetical protein
MNFTKGFQGMSDADTPRSFTGMRAALAARSLISTGFPANLRRDFKARQRDG